MAHFNDELDRAGRYRKVYQAKLQSHIEYRDEHFKRRYRLDKERLMDLALDYAPWSRTDGSTMGGGMSHFQQVCTAVRYLATGATFTSIADAQRTSNATVSRCVEDLSDYFYDTSNRYICWPYRVQDKTAIAHKFYQKPNGQPRIMGVIDGTHVAIISPHKPREAVFVNRKGYYSLNCMVVCDSSNMILTLDSSLAGSANDAYQFSTTTIYEEAEAGGWGDFVLLGDSGYGLKNYLLTPYFNPHTPRQRAFNTWHASTRSVIERTIGLLKQRFRCLDASGGYLYHQPERCAKIVVACGCLHNMAVMDREEPVNVLRDNAGDAYRRVRNEPDQPQDFHQEEPEEEALDARDMYARTNFPQHDN